MSQIEIVETEAGTHLRIDGRNGEPLVGSEVHPDGRDAENALVALAEVFVGKGNASCDGQALVITGHSPEHLTLPIEHLSE